MGSLLRYTFFRVLVFVAVFIPLAALGVRPLLLAAAIGVIASGIASYFLLSGVRNQAGQDLEAKIGDGPLKRLSARIETSKSAEDAADDAARGITPTDAEAGPDASGEAPKP